MSLVGVNHLQPILHISKILVHCYPTDETIDQFAIGYMINPSLNSSKLFRKQVERCLIYTFRERTMETIRDCLWKNNTCLTALIIIYENNGIKPKKVQIVLSFVFNTLVNNYVCIDYLPCESKTLSTISSKPTF